MPATDLGAVIQNSDSQVDVEVLAEAADVNSMYEEAVINLKTRKPVLRKGTAGVVSAAEKEQAAKDYYASVRTNVCHSTRLRLVLSVVDCDRMVLRFY